MQPTRPVIDLEPCYENHPYHADGSGYHENPQKWDRKTRGTAALIREQAWWAMLAGAAGHTYASQDVWQFYDEKRPLPEYPATTPWRKAMDFPGAVQMGIMRRLFESRRRQTLEPDQSLIAAGQGSGESHLQAARAADGTFLIVYLPRGGDVAVDTTKISGKEAIGHWFNPRDGRATQIGRFNCSAARQFTPPSQGIDNDWVLVLDEAKEQVPVPGARQPSAPKRP